MNRPKCFLPKTNCHNTVKEGTAIRHGLPLAAAFAIAFSCGCGSHDATDENTQSPVGPTAGFESPEESFEAFQKAGVANDFPGAVSCLSPKSYDAVAATITFPLTLTAAFDPGKRDEINPAEVPRSTRNMLELPVQGEVSRHVLLVPEAIEFDLNGSTLLLDLRHNSHGVRLSSRSAIRNGSIRVVQRENNGSQANWYSAVSVRAPYDDGGTPDGPGHFYKVAQWKIEDMTIDQQVVMSAIQLMSEACFGEIRRVRILDSEKAVMGIGMDWGVGKFTTADDQIPHIRELRETVKSTPRIRTTS